MALKIIVMGTGPFAVPSFEALRRSEDTIIAVVTKPEPPVKSRKGPPPAPVRTWANEHSLPIFDPVSINEDAAVEQLQLWSPDLLVVCDYGHILKPAALESARLGGINLHGSLLPAYRGAAPVQRALLSGDPITGVSVIHMTPRLDGGPILAKATTEIQPGETSGELEERLSSLGVDLVVDSIETLRHWDGETAIGETQDATKVTRAPRLHKREAHIDWGWDRSKIDCHVRGMQPWPIAYTEIQLRQGKPPQRIAVLRVSPVEGDVAELQPGQVTGDQELIVCCGDGLLRLDEIRPAGKNQMSGEQWLRGHQLKRGSTFSAPIDS
ncbi:methionyl-tRNA formyltransferase [Roseiconus lacunae]|uniref:methionyl-tRNA formyltransferase n=1 Tax=Roseiconus lacunae TaxID=2605694 RepID=UPI0028F41F65|nr:methionyl-tRNA formyltransferase [Roseiconus lacunae]